MEAEIDSTHFTLSNQVTQILDYVKEGQAHVVVCQTDKELLTLAMIDTNVTLLEAPFQQIIMCDIREVKLQQSAKEIGQVLKSIPDVDLTI